jgi:hypothetical protein
LPPRPWFYDDDPAARYIGEGEGGLGDDPSRIILAENWRPGELATRIRDQTEMTLKKKETHWSKGVNTQATRFHHGKAVWPRV